MVATEDLIKEKGKVKMSMVEQEETRKDVSETADADPQSIIPGTNMPLGLADELAQRLQDEENEAIRREEAERKLEEYKSKAAAKRALQKMISQKESDKAQRKPWQNELIASGRFQMRDLIRIKMSTLSEMVKQVRKDQITTQQNITVNLNSSQSTPTELLEIKIEFAEKPKDLSPHQSPTRKEVSTLSSQYVIKRDDNTRETFKCISDVMELSNIDLQKIVSLGIDIFNDSESARLLIQALKKKVFNVHEEEKKEEEPLEVIPIVSWELLGKTGQFLITYQNGVQEYLSADRIVTLVPDDMRALLKIPLKNDSNDQMGEFVKDAMHRQLDGLSFSESTQGDENEEKKEQFFGNEDDPDSNDIGESPADNEVPLTQSQTLIS
ncbi:hypothetical protein L1987_42391 [Smallanthus sonchifolius]|uniref:Uncharacterized protein n=1 Tax=Smallanthus sonchifolius TaxID=185202 RepID=A0ACB9GJG6_9ASTR|nr:hypothetical protein L1987_42391 [Smallanthus sonchifolius]